MAARFPCTCRWHCGFVAVRSPRATTPMPVIGYLSARSPEDTANLLAAFRSGLAENGVVESRNVAIEHRWARGRVINYDPIALSYVESLAQSGGGLRGE
jgi:putative tryptophan/tyrosine transport system substrate-binding protein